MRPRPPNPVLRRTRPRTPLAASTWLAMVLSLATLSPLGCDRIDVRPIATQTPLEDPHESVIAVQLRPDFFRAVSDHTSQWVRERARVTWTRDFIDEVLDDGTELVLGPFEVPMELDGLELTPTDAGILVSARYVSAHQRTSVRFVETGAPTICRLDVDLKPRTLEFVLVPTTSGWEASVIRSFSADEEVGFAPIEACAYPLKSVNWLLLSSRIDAILSGKANAEYLPLLRDLVLSQLSLPDAGLLLVTDTQGFFEPRDVRLGTAISSAAPWGAALEVTDVFGVRAVYDAALSGETAPCAESLEFDPPAVSPLQTSSTPRLSPSGKPFDVLMIVDKGFVAALLGQLAKSGYACGDLRFGRAGSLSAFDLVFPELTEAEGFDFGRSGRVRIQPRGVPTLSVPAQNTVRWWLPNMHFSVYGTSDDVLVQVAEVTAGLRIDTVVESIATGALGFEVTAVEPTEVTANLDFLRAVGVTLDANEIASRLGRELLESNIVLPLPTPFGHQLRVSEALERQGAIWFYLTLDLQ